MIWFTLLLMTTAFLASLSLLFQPRADSWLRLFPFFLFLCIIEESTSIYLQFQHKENIFLSNPFTILVFCFYFFTFRQIVHNLKAKKGILYILCTYPVIAFLNMYLIQKPNVFHTMTYSLGCLLVVACCIYYFFELFQLSRMVNLLRQPAFWICSGLLFYFACSLFLYGFNNLLMKYAPLGIVRNLMILFNFLDVFLYSSFIIAFLCRIRVRKSML